MGTRMRIASGLGILLTVLGVACSQPQSQPAQSPAAEEPAGRLAGGPCEYVDVVGKCTISKIEAAAPGDFQCEGGSQKVSFQFSPDDASAKLEYGGPDPKSGTLTAGGGQHPSAAWLEANSVQEGASFSCTRRHIQHGTCSPVVWEFAALKLDEAPCR